MLNLGCTKRRILNGLCFETRKRLLAVRGGSEGLQSSCLMLGSNHSDLCFPGSDSA
ncbi:MAG: hypothetical protein U9Q89_03315 [Thermodesulfobacteriota bacterium]|nr:hypothetical protein [Thermodesulfobacteriota bacterium]